MTTDITIIDPKELQDFINETGASQEALAGGTDFLPNLIVNYNDNEKEDGTGRELKPGTFFISDQEPLVYAKNVTIRPLLHSFQWTDYDSDLKKTKNRTIFVNDLTDEARDELGTLKCGKPLSKVLRENPELAEKYKDIKCYRTVHVLVSYTGTDIDGNEHVIENFPAVMRLKGTNFMPFAEEYLNLLPKGSLIWDYKINLGTKRRKEGSVVFWVTNYEPDFTTKVSLDVTTYETMKVMQTRIKDLNKAIDKKYYDKLNANKSSDAAIDALDITPNSLDSDFEDELDRVLGPS